MGEFSYLLIQAFGFVFFALYATASFRKTRTGFFSQEALGAFGMAAQTLMLGSVMGFVTNNIHAIMVMFGRFHPEVKISQRVLSFGVIATILCTMLVWESNLINMICLIATLINYVARACKNDLVLRSLSVLGCLLWLAYHIMLGSWAGMFFAMIAIGGHGREILKPYLLQMRVPVHG